jgi:hypothetical protein
MKCIVVRLPAGQANISVSFTGDYVRKRELDVVIRAIKREHKRVLRSYRKRQIIAEHEKSKSLRGDLNGTDGQSTERSDERPGRPAEQGAGADVEVSTGTNATGDRESEDGASGSEVNENS